MQSAELKYELKQTVDEIWNDCIKLTIDIETTLKQVKPLHNAKTKKIIRNFMSYYPDHMIPFSHLYAEESPAYTFDLYTHRWYNDDYIINIDL